MRKVADTDPKSTQRLPKVGDDNDGESETVKTPMVWKWNNDSLVKDNGDEVMARWSHIGTIWACVPIVLSMKSECGRTLHS